MRLSWSRQQLVHTLLSKALCWEHCCRIRIKLPVIWHIDLKFCYDNITKTMTHFNTVWPHASNHLKINSNVWLMCLAVVAPILFVCVWIDGGWITPAPIGGPAGIERKSPRPAACVRHVLCQHLLCRHQVSGSTHLVARYRLGFSMLRGKGGGLLSLGGIVLYSPLLLLLNGIKNAAASRPNPYRSNE